MNKAAFPINVLFGLPDDGKGNVRPSADGISLVVNLPGTSSITPYLSPKRFDVNVRRPRVAAVQSSWRPMPCSDQKVVRLR